MSNYTSVEIDKDNLDSYLDRYDEAGWTLVSCAQTQPYSHVIGEISDYKIKAKFLLIFKKNN